MKRKYSETFEETQSRKKYRILKEEVEKLFTSLFFKFLYNSLLMNFDNITRWLLVDVNISNNKIDVLPRKLGALHCLQRLDLSHNCLSRLYGWTWLKEKHIKRTLCFLDISHNSLPELSSHIWKLNALVELKISHNWLEHLPENIQNAQNLRILDLSHNFLKYLPAKIIYLELQTLDVSMNPFAKKWECDILVPSLAQFAAKTLEQYCRYIAFFDLLCTYVL
ncbi:Malignant fibrous histiocytoma-amplified sequence 1 [Cyphomyrmex costatus]|uniref:Leucine-rich repeat protein soc-2 homolog n=1 Tax=Cyphomyrmex costatus TaxID=456900 RepID=A0A195CKN9_9HYME|nr:Malignant fibrous histiocytoma-amplified sequence 1 [Cyphomyrmex costatus]